MHISYWEDGKQVNRIKTIYLYTDREAEDALTLIHDTEEAAQEGWGERAHNKKRLNREFCKFV